MKVKVFAKILGESNAHLNIDSRDVWVNPNGGGQITLYLTKEQVDEFFEWDKRRSNER